ncbi:hypothetical protein [Winogradskyella sp.]|uniref:hypothetical protein n=1 Tax=Winogradskyella sp. TaxID=1883156 RepID=UPI003AA7CDC0
MLDDVQALGSAIDSVAPVLVALVNKLQESSELIVAVKSIALTQSSFEGGQ